MPSIMVSRMSSTNSAISATVEDFRSGSSGNSIWEGFAQFGSYADRKQRISAQAEKFIMNSNGMNPQQTFPYFRNFSLCGIGGRYILGSELRAHASGAALFRRVGFRKKGHLISGSKASRSLGTRIAPSFVA